MQDKAGFIRARGQPLVLPRQSRGSAALLVSRTRGCEGAFASTRRRIANADGARELAPWPAVLVGALALLLAGAIFKLARRRAQSSRRARRQVGRLRIKQKGRAYSGHMAARPDQIARTSALLAQRDDPVWPRPTSIDPVEATTLGQLVADRQRAAA